LDRAALNACEPAAATAAMLPVLAASTDIPLSDIGLYELRDSVRPTRPWSVDTDDWVERPPPTAFADPAPLPACITGRPTPAAGSWVMPSPARPGKRSAMAGDIKPADIGFSDDAVIAAVAALARPS